MEGTTRPIDGGSDDGGRNYTPVSVGLCCWILADSDHRAMPCAVPATHNAEITRERNNHRKEDLCP